MGRPRKTKPKLPKLKTPMNEVFATQLDPTAFVKSVSFLILEDSGQQKVGTCLKNKLDTIPETFELVEHLPNRLPVFIRK